MVEQPYGIINKLYKQHITVPYIHRYCFGTKEIFYCRLFNFCTGVLIDHPKKIRPTYHIDIVITKG